MKKIFLSVSFLTLSIALISSCKKEASKSSNTNSQPKNITALSRELPGWYRISRGVLWKDNQGFLRCGPAMSFCHVSDGVGILPGEPDVVGLKLLSASIVVMENTTTSTLGTINISLAHDLPNSFAVAEGFSSITVQPGIYPKLIDPTHPLGYYLFNVISNP